MSYEKLTAPKQAPQAAWQAIWIILTTFEPNSG